ncbi:MAG TPA: HlyD family efflux transporter periplasmic adaptor subunit [Pseudonocardiaceae bacterium]|nr:HlyD family efflux transporter periplasmic adaptor subunit [Pseudonocardiaceae bacterium]
MTERQGSGSATQANDTSDAVAPPSDGSSTESLNGYPVRKHRRPSGTVLVMGLVVLALLLITGGVTYLLYTERYVTTDNAQVDGDQIQINAPQTGVVIHWQGTVGSQVRSGQVVGRIEVQGSGAQPQRVIRAPGDGTIAVNPTVEGQWVTAGTNLATAYNGNGIYATARVDETDVADVHLGALVDMDVDAYSGIPVTGIVTEIQDSAAAEFSLFPESNSSGNFQKVTQVIPVRIAFTNTGGVPLAPGMNITVRIHKHK